MLMELMSGKKSCLFRGMVHERVTGQTYCGLGFDLPDYAVLVVDILEIEPQ